MTRLLQTASVAEDGTARVNMAQWFNFITFDIIGDLSFGESFHCLERSQYHPWIAILFSHFKALALSTCCRFFPILERLMLYTLPKAVKQQRIDHFNMSKEKVHQRIAAQQDQTWRNADFMAHVLRHNDEKGMSLPEIEATFNMLVVAGSETTATALAGIMNYLMKDSTVLEPLVHEIRNSFALSSEITADRVGKLPCLNAVIEEGLRLCQPVPLGLPRKVPAGGATVCGRWLPGNVSSKPASFLIFPPLHYSSVCPLMKLSPQTPFLCVHLLSLSSSSILFMFRSVFFFGSSPTFDSIPLVPSLYPFLPPFSLCILHLKPLPVLLGFKFSPCVSFSDLRLCSPIRHLTFRAQLLLAYCISSQSLAFHLRIRRYDPGEYLVHAIVLPPSHRQSSGFSPLLNRESSLHRAKSCVLGNAPHSRTVTLDF